MVVVVIEVKVVTVLTLVVTVVEVIAVVVYQAGFDSIQIQSVFCVAYFAECIRTTRSYAWSNICIG